MKKVFIASAIFVGSLVFTKASAQLFVSARVEFAAPPIPIVVSGPRASYPVPVPRYQQPLSVEYYRTAARVGYYHQMAPGYFRENRNCYRDRYYKHGKYRKNW